MPSVKSLYENNRRRESHAVTATLPFVLESADLRAGTPQLEVAAGDYTALTLPTGIIVTGGYVIIETGSEYTDGDLSVEIGGVEVFATGANNLVTAGISALTGTPLLLEGDADVVLKVLNTPAGTDSSMVKVVIEYVDYNRATMSYIGED